MNTILFATYAHTEEQLYNVILLEESLRTFGGLLSNAELLLFLPEDLEEVALHLLEARDAQNIALRISAMPDVAKKFYYSGKVFAGAHAEREAEGRTDFLVWLDDDTLFLNEPSLFLLEENQNLGYRPVMHQNVGSSYSESPDTYWTRIFELIEVPEESIFPMKTVADNKQIRPYFNAGILVVRPGKKLLRHWAEAYSVVYSDQQIAMICDQDVKKNVFLHQAVLSATIMKNIKRNEMVQFPDTINYPLFFHTLFDSEKEFSTLNDVITLRYDLYFSKPDPDWAEQIVGPKETIDWLTQRLPIKKCN